MGDRDELDENDDGGDVGDATSLSILCELDPETDGGGRSGEVELEMAEGESGSGGSCSDWWAVSSAGATACGGCGGDDVGVFIWLAVIRSSNEGRALRRGRPSPSIRSMDLGDLTRRHCSLLLIGCPVAGISGG